MFFFLISLSCYYVVAVELVFLSDHCSYTKQVLFYRSDVEVNTEKFRASSV